MGQLGQFIIHHWALWIALIVVLAAIFISELQEQKKRGKELSPQAAIKLINDDNAVVIDLRDADSYRKGHIIGAIRASSEDFEQGRMDKYKSSQLVIVCAKGLQSAAVASKLKQQGFEQATVLSGGMSAWQASDLPIVKGK